MGLYIGCPIWGSKRWVGSLFPKGSHTSEFLSLYARRFLTVEGNTTFYGMPNPDRILKWREETPLGFQFCLKFPRSISHALQPGENEAEVQTWLERLQTLGDRRGPSFLQLPSEFSPKQFQTLVTFLQKLPSDIKFAVEVRHPGFFLPPFESELDQLLSHLKMARVLYDVRGLRSAKPTSLAIREAQKQKPQVPVRFTRTTDFLFVRYMSHPEVERNTEWLNEWATQIIPCLKLGLDVYFFVHHIDDFYMPAICQKLYQKLMQEVLLPAVAFDRPAQVVSIQQSLF